MIYIIRHSATDYNDAKPSILQGKGIDASINERGIILARKTAAFFAEKDIHEIYTSPMKRALETAEIINTKNIPLRVVDEIVECNLGLFEGLTYEQVKEKYPVDYHHQQGDCGDRKFKGGESYRDVLSRVIPFFASLDITKNIVVVSHGIVNKAYIAFMFGMPLKHAKLLHQDNCCINTVSESVTVNYVGHLKE